MRSNAILPVSPLISATLTSGQIIHCCDLRIRQWEIANEHYQASGLTPEEVLEIAEENERAEAVTLWPMGNLLRLKVPYNPKGPVIWTVMAQFIGPLVQELEAPWWTRTTPEFTILNVLWRQSEPYAGPSPEVLQALSDLEWEWLGLPPFWH